LPLQWWGCGTPARTKVLRSKKDPCRKKKKNTRGGVVKTKTFRGKKIDSPPGKRGQVKGWQKVGITN